MLVTEKPVSPESPQMTFGDVIILTLKHDKLKLVTLTEKSYTDCGQGHFPHHHFVGKPFGSQIYSKKGDGYVFALRPDPSLFSLALEHKTQIIYSADIALILHLLELKRGSVVFESGTGSCSLTASLAQRVGDMGRVYTFEFNHDRYLNAKKVTKMLGLGNVVCNWQNVIENGFLMEDFAAEKGEFSGFGLCYRVVG